MKKGLFFDVPMPHLVICVCRSGATPIGFATHSASFASGTKSQVCHTYGTVRVAYKLYFEKATNKSSSLKLGKTNTVLAENNSYITLHLRKGLHFSFFFSLSWVTMPVAALDNAVSR